MKILWLNWKDLANPLAGGAEVVTEEIASRLAADGHQITLLTAGFDGAPKKEIKNGYTIIRVGSRFTVYWHAFRYYRRHLKGMFDIIIDEMNTVPFFAGFYAREKTIMFVHQLAREIWFYEVPFPLSIAGYFLEPIYIRLARLRSKFAITVSKSTERDLVMHGFKQKNVHIISEGIRMHPVENFSMIEKYKNPTVISLGRIGPMKRVDHIIRAFEIAKRNVPNLELIIAGAYEGSHGKMISRIIKSSSFADSIRYEGRVSSERKAELMKKAHVLAVASVKEGWCLTVTEAASQGTPAAVYNVDGLRDSVRDGITGIITKENSPAGLAASIVKVLSNLSDYERLRDNAWQWSKEITFERSYADFLKILKKYA